MSIRSASISIIVCAVLATPSAAQTPNAYATVSKQRVLLGNRYMQRNLSLAGETVRTTQLENKLAGKKYESESREFVIRIDGDTKLSADDFTLADKPQITDVADGGKRATFRLENKKSGIKAKLMYEVLTGDFYMRKWLQIEFPPEEHLLNTIEVENLRIRDADLFLGGPAPQDLEWPQKGIHYHLGQPIYADNFFLGLECPAAENSFDKSDTIRLRQYLGRKVSGKTLESRKSVLGVAPGKPLNRVGDWFFRYIDRIRVRPVRRYISCNTWWTTKRPTEKKILMIIDKLEEEFPEKGIPLDAIVIDAFWQSDGWEINKKVFPNGFTPIKKRLDEIGMDLGLWMGFSMGGGKAEWLTKHGYEITQAKHACFAGPNWSRNVREKLLGYFKNDGIACWKNDYTVWGCNRTDHGHLGGPYAIAAQTDVMIEILKSLRQIDPDAYLYNGFWISPWWLMHADSVWPQVCDYQIDMRFPATCARHQQITSRDGYLHRRVVKDKYQFPLNSMMTVEPIRACPPEIFKKMPPEAGADSPQFTDKEDPLDAWTDNVVMHFCRGNALTEMYVSPWLLQGAHGDNLRRVIKWGMENTDILLPRTRMILGDPRKLEMYGYAHIVPEQSRGIIALRNPGFGAQSAGIMLDESLGLPRTNDAHVFETIYPYRKALPRTFRYGDKLHCSLQGYQTMVLQSTTLKHLPRPLLAGVRYEMLKREPTKAVYEVAGLPGSKVPCMLLCKISDKANLMLDGRPQEVDNDSQVTLTFPGESHRLSVETLQAVRKADEFMVDVPQDYKNPALEILCKGPGAEKLACTITNNGRPVAVKAVKPKKSGYFVKSGKDWQIFRAELPTGRNRLACKIAPTPGKTIKATALVSAHAPLVKRRLEMSFQPQPNNPKPQQLLPVLSPDYEKQVIPLPLRFPE